MPQCEPFNELTGCRIADRFWRRGRVGRLALPDQIERGLDGREVTRERSTFRDCRACRRWFCFGGWFRLVAFGRGAISVLAFLDRDLALMPCRGSRVGLLGVRGLLLSLFLMSTRKRFARNARDQ